MVASDRISTYDVVHPTPIPDKGKVLTGLSAFWFERTGHVCPNHVVSFTDVPDEMRGRAMLVERLEMVPVECVVRGYITGSGWKDYQAHRRDLRDRAARRASSESEQLPEPIFTPATKAEVGDHDENVDFDRAAEIVGDRAAARGAAPAVDRALRARRRPRPRARDHPRRHQVRVRPRPDGTIVAGRRGAHARLVALLAGRRLRAGPRPARRSTSSTCATGPPARAGTRRRPRPALPDDVVEGTRARYAEAYERITGEPLLDLAGARRGASDVQGACADPAEGGHSRSTGPGGRASASRTRVRGRRERARRAIGRVRRGGSGSQVPAMCEKLLANPLIEDYEVIEVPGV